MMTYASRAKKLVVLFLAAAIVTIVGMTWLAASGVIGHLSISLPAMLIAETAGCGYALYKLRTASVSDRPSPPLISGAVFAAAYPAAVLAVVVVADMLLGVPIGVYGIVQLLLLLAAAGVLAAARIYGRHADSQEQKDQAATYRMKAYAAELRELKALARDWGHADAGRLSALLARLEEDFRYSDPVTHPAVMEAEEMLGRQLSALRDQVSLQLTLPDLPGDWEAQTERLRDDISRTLGRRNRELTEVK